MTNNVYSVIKIPIYINSPMQFTTSYKEHWPMAHIYIYYTISNASMTNKLIILLFIRKVIGHGQVFSVTLERVEKILIDLKS